MSTETVTKTYSSTIPVQTFDNLKTIENGFQMKREFVLAGIAEYILSLPSAEQKKVHEFCVKAQQAEAKEKGANGGFFTERYETTIKTPEKPAPKTPDKPKA